MKIYTILGTISPRENQEPAKYRFDTNLSKFYTLKQERYVNMFPLLLENKAIFNADEVVAIYTKEARVSQEFVKESGLECEFKDEYFIENENDFYRILKVINLALEDSDNESILDLTHGFRHFPILATISIISQNLQGNKNLKHIFFAKEIVKFKEYEIIDLKEYLEIANLSIILENFSDNYTISSNVTFDNDTFQEVADDLRIISNHILANSFKKIYDDNTLTKLINSLETLEVDEKLSGFDFQDILNHIKEIKELENKQEYEKFFELPKMLSDKGYLLNAITLLYEASSLYCAFAIEKISKNLKNHIDAYRLQKDFSVYALTNISRRMVACLKNEREERLKDKFLKIEKVNKFQDYTNNQLKQHDLKIRNEIFTFLDKQNQNTLADFRDFLNNIKTLRDNLAHANSSETIDNAKQELKKAQDNFYIFCIKDNILRA